MIFEFLARQLELGFWSLLGFLDRSVSGAMGCFFGCFRIRDGRSRPHLVSASTRSKSSESVSSRNCLSNLFLDEEKGDSPCNEREKGCLDSPQIDKGLKDEAKFLKACGTIPETPAEIRKASGKLKHSPPSDGDAEKSKFRSWLSSGSIDKSQFDKQPYQSPTKLCEEWGRSSVSLEQTPSSCITHTANPGRISTSSAEDNGALSVDAVAKNLTNETDKAWFSASNIQGKSKSVRFECTDFDASSSRGSSSEYGSRFSKKFESSGNQRERNFSPNPTPLKLSDEMQTPGTVFAANPEAFANGRTRVRSQYVYSVLNPVDNASERKTLTEEQPSSKEVLGEVRESFEQPDHAAPRPEVGVEEISIGNELNVEESLSSWLKPKTRTHEDNNQNFQDASSKIPRFGRNPGDRPIIGMVAAHWNVDEPSHISPKWWDGNGIPNSTTKYKEDQKVSWHATPFEERLEKALSEESLMCQRKGIHQTPIVFEETDESDTAISQLRPSTSAQSKSVVSC